MTKIKIKIKKKEKKKPHTTSSCHFQFPEISQLITYQKKIPRYLSLFCAYFWFYEVALKCKAKFLVELHYADFRYKDFHFARFDGIKIRY